MKYMFDSNVFDKIIPLVEKIKADENDSYYICPMQVEELAAIPDKEKRTMIWLAFANLRAILVPSSVAVVGVSRVGLSKVSSGNVYNEIKGNSKNAVFDGIIADTAVAEDCCLVTSDKRLINQMRSHNYEVLSFEDFLIIKGLDSLS